MRMRSDSKAVKKFSWTSSRFRRRRRPQAQKAKQNKEVWIPVFACGETGMTRDEFSQRAYPPGSRPPHTPRILLTGAAPVPFGLWEGRPGGWERLGFTVRPLSRDVDPGKPDQKAGRESPLARLSSERSRELMVSGQGLAAPKSSRILLPETPAAVRGGR